MRPIAETAPMLDGWELVRDGIPKIGVTVDILHFGGTDEAFEGSGTVDAWGIRPITDGGHGKRSTVTHWRRVRPLGNERGLDEDFFCPDNSNIGTNKSSVDGTCDL